MNNGQFFSRCILSWNLTFCFIVMLMADLLTDPTERFLLYFRRQYWTCWSCRLHMEHGRDRILTSSCVDMCEWRRSAHRLLPFCIMQGKTERSLHAYNTSGVWRARYTYREKASKKYILGVEWFTGHFCSTVAHIAPMKPSVRSKQLGSVTQPCWHSFPI